MISDAQQDNSKQVAQVETFIRQKPDLLIVAPNERAALTAVMGQAMEAKIPVICLERDILQPNYTTYIHSDNVAIGRLAGQFIVDHLTKKYGKPKGKIVAMRGLLGVEGEINRDRGAREVFDEISRASRSWPIPVADWIQAKAKDRMTEVLRAQPQIDVVYGHNDPMAIGAYLAAKELGPREGNDLRRRGWPRRPGRRHPESDGRHPGRDFRLSACASIKPSRSATAFCTNPASSPRRNTRSTRSW